MKFVAFKTVGIVALFAVASVFGQSGDFTVSGKVVDGSGAAVPMATITYTSVAQRLSFDFSRADGTFGNPTSISPRSKNPRITMLSSGPVTLELFNMAGKKINTTFRKNIDKGTYTIEPGSANLSEAMYVVKITAGKSVTFQKLINTGNIIRNSTGNSPSLSNDGMVLTKELAAVDTIRVGKTGYTPTKVPITTYTDNVGNVTIAALNIETEVTNMFNSMSQAEKIGQVIMPINTAVTNAQAASQLVGSIFGGGGAFATYTPTSLATWCAGYQTAMQGTTHKIPLMISYDGVHGMDVLPGGTILPHNMGLGAIQDSTIIQKAFRVAALEIRATGANWTFGPCIAVIRDDRWGRAYEGFAETPELTSKMARYSVLGLQTTDLSLPWAIAATVKHFAGDGGTTNGVNPGVTSGTDAAARLIHLPGYTAAIQAGTACVMPSLSAWPNASGSGSTAMHCNASLLTDWLKTQQGFSGFVVGDWQGHDACDGSTPIPSINFGLDVPMVNGDATNATTVAVINAITAGYGTRVDDACKRVLRVKYRMNLFNQYANDSRLISLVGSAAHRDVARAAVRNSLVLLKNANTALPIAKTARVAIWGTGADNIGIQCGAWTCSDPAAGALATWQGTTNAHYLPGCTIKQGFDTLHTSPGSVTYSANGDASATALANIDVVIAVLSENPYAETSFGAISLTSSVALTGYPSSVNGAQYTTPSNATVITNIAAAKALNKKVIVVLMAGRPLDISPVINNCDAFVWACLPGTEGKGIAEVLYNDQGYHFAGKLPVSWPGSATNYTPVTSGALYAVGTGITPY
jgi:beta-glucosidase